MQELKEDHAKTKETLSPWQEYSHLLDQCFTRLQQLQGQCEDLWSSTSQPETQAAFQSVQVSLSSDFGKKVKSLRSVLGLTCVRHSDPAAVAGICQRPAEQDGRRPPCLQGPCGKTGYTGCWFDPIRVPASVPQHLAAAEEDIWKDSKSEGWIIKYGRRFFFKSQALAG